MYSDTNYGGGLSILDDLFQDGPIGYREKEKYRGCFEVIDQAQRLVDSFTETLELSLNLTQSETFSEALSYAERIVPLYSGFLTPNATYSEMDSKVKGACSIWVSDLKVEVEDSIDGAREQMEKAESTFQRALIFYDTLTHEFNTLTEMIETTMYPAVNATMGYQAGRLTKLELSNFFTSNKFTEDTNTLTQKNNEVRDLVRGYVSEMNIGEETLTNAYKILLDLEIPFYYSGKFFRLSYPRQLFVTYGDGYEEYLNTDQEDDSSDNDVRAETANETSALFFEYVVKNLENLKGPIQDIEARVVDNVQKLISQIQILTKNLQEFKTSTVMDSTFYL